MAQEVFYATSDDANNFLHVNEGDLCIRGLNSAGRIYITESLTVGGSTLKLNTNPGENNKVCLFANTPSQASITLHEDVKGPLISSSGERDPLIVTNVEGQFLLNRDTTSISGLSITALGTAMEITGKYDPERKTGHPDFRGIFHPLGWAYAKDRMGIRAHNRWQAGNLNTSFTVQGNDRRLIIDSISSGEGGFSGVTVKTELKGQTLTFQEIEDNYDFSEFTLRNSIFHDTDSEGIYLGSTQSPAHKFQNVLIENVLFLRAGSEAMQLGHIGYNTKIKNVTIYAPDSWWLNAFQQSQDKGCQFNFRCGNITIEKFIIDGGGSNSIILFNDGNYPDSHRIENLPFKMIDGYIGRGRNYACYMNPSDGGLSSFGENPTPVVFENISVGNFNDDYKRLAPFSAVNSTLYFNLGNAPSSKHFKDCTYESGRSLATGQNITYDNNTAVATVPAPKYVNTGFGQLDPRKFSHWFARVGESAPGFNGQYSHNQTAPGEVVGTVTIGEDTTITLVDLPMKGENEIYTRWIGREVRIYDKNNPYDNFSVHILSAVNKETKQLSLGGSMFSSNPGTYSEVEIDKEEAFIKFDINDVVKDTLGLNFGFFKFIGSGSKYLSAGRKPYESPLYWEQLLWEGKAEPPDDYRQAEDSPYPHYGIYNIKEEEIEPPIVIKTESTLKARRRMMYSIMSKRKQHSIPSITGLYIEYVDGIVLYWDSYEGAIQYDIWKSTNGVDFIQVHYIPEEEFFGFWLDQEEEPGTYYYKVRAKLEGSIYSGWSEAVNIEMEEEPVNRGTVTNVTYTSVYGSGQNFGYKQYVPADYDGNTATPLVIWLHGLGERSQSNGNPQFGRLELYGPFKEYKDFEADYPFLMIAPQQPTDVDGKYTGRGSWDVEVIEESLNHFKAQGYNIDLDRVYITGQSMGGGGVLSYINSAYGNETIAAALPIATTLPNGTGIACNIKHIPIWLFHAENDPTVSSNNSKNLYTAIQACTPAPDVEPKITIFDLSGHVGWNQVYRNTGAAITGYADNSPFPDGTTWEDWLLQYSLQS